MITSKMEYWNRFKKNEGYEKINNHIYNVFRSVLYDTSYAQLSAYERELFKWLCLFHDCAKLAIPDVKTHDCRDPAHPFRSAHQALIQLKKLNLIELPDSRLNYWNKIFESAYELNKTSNAEIHNNSAIPKIILFLDNCVGPKYRMWADMIKITLLH